MTSFSCPHFAQHRDWCQRLNDWCVPGRPGCVIPKTTVFAVPWQQRLAAKLAATAAAGTPAAGLGLTTSGTSDLE